MYKVTISVEHKMGEQVKIALLPNKVRKRSGTMITTGILLLNKDKCVPTPNTFLILE